MTSDNADFLERCLHEVWEELTARGFVIEEPGAFLSQCLFRDLPDARCEIDLLRTGALVWLYTPLTETCPEQAARMVLALLTTAPISDRPPAARHPGLPLKEAAAWMLIASGLVARPVDIRYGSGEVCTMIKATNPGLHARGSAWIGDEGTIRWECPLGIAAGDLAPRDVAESIAAALTHNRSTEQHGSGDRGPDEAAPT